MSHDTTNVVNKNESIYCSTYLELIVILKYLKTIESG